MGEAAAFLPFPPPMSRRRAKGPVRIQLWRRSARLWGGVSHACADIGIPTQRDFRPGFRGVTLIPLDRVDDLIAWLEHREDRHVELLEDDR